jgi:hypothetical protein
MFNNLAETVRSKLPCRPREGGDPVSFAAKPLDSRWSLPPSACVGGGNDTELLMFVANQVAFCPVARSRQEVLWRRLIVT